MIWGCFWGPAYAPMRIRPGRGGYFGLGLNTPPPLVWASTSVRADFLGRSLARHRHAVVREYKPNFIVLPRFVGKNRKSRHFFQSRLGPHAHQLALDIAPHKGVSVRGDQRIERRRGSRRRVGRRHIKLEAAFTAHESSVDDPFVARRRVEKSRVRGFG